jgi:hypothetical protein
MYKIIPFIAVFVLFSCLPMLVFGQNTKKKKLTYGASIGLEASNLAWFSYWQQGQKISRIGVGKVVTGASLGGFAQYTLTKTIVFRVGLQGAMSACVVNFQREDEDFFSEKYDFKELEMPLHFVFTNRKGSFPLRGSMILGARLGWNFENIPDAHHLKLYKDRVGFDTGLGIEVNLKKVRFQPEFLYSFTINNQNDATLTDSYWGVGRTVRDRLTFRMVFFMQKKTN